MSHESPDPSSFNERIRAQRQAVQDEVRMAKEAKIAAEQEEERRSLLAQEICKQAVGLLVEGNVPSVPIFTQHKIGSKIVESSNPHTPSKKDRQDITEMRETARGWQVTHISYEDDGGYIPSEWLGLQDDGTLLDIQGDFGQSWVRTEIRGPKYITGEDAYNAVTGGSFEKGIAHLLEFDKPLH